MGTPDWNSFLADAWGPSIESTEDFDAVELIAAASNVVVGQNPAYTLQDFFTMFPKFAGPVLLSGTSAPTGNFTAGSENFTVNNPAGIAVGQPIAGAAIPDNTFITSISGNTVGMTNPALANATNAPVLIWNATTIPIPVLLVFIALASAHLVQARWADTWVFAMGLFVAHFATLYAQSDGNPEGTVGQIAAQGIGKGIQVAKSVGDVTVSYEPVGGLENWGAWNLTSYGQQLATFARIIGMGPMLLY